MSYTKIMECKRCGKKFLLKHPREIYCGKKCRWTTQRAAIYCWRAKNPGWWRKDFRKQKSQIPQEKNQTIFPQENTNV